MSEPAKATAINAKPRVPPGYAFLSRVPFPLLCCLARFTFWHRLPSILRFARDYHRHAAAPCGRFKAMWMAMLQALGAEEHRAWILACRSLSGRDVRRWVRTKGRGHLESARRAERPLLLVMIHQMPARAVQHALNQPDLAWEPWLVRADPKIYPRQMPYAEFFDQERLHSVWGGRILPHGLAGMRRLYSVLKAGGAAVLTLDGPGWAARPGTGTPVLGRWMGYSLGAARLATDTGALVLPFVVRTGFMPGSTTLRFLAPRDPAGKSAEAFRAEIGRLLEEMILCSPESWMEWETWFGAGSIPS
jgi:lauroyl/myristoyl acyltransferase